MLNLKYLDQKVVLASIEAVSDIKWSGGQAPTELITGCDYIAIDKGRLVGTKGGLGRVEESPNDFIAKCTQISPKSTLAIGQVCLVKHGETDEWQPVIHVGNNYFSRMLSGDTYSFKIVKPTKVNVLHETTI